MSEIVIPEPKLASSPVRPDVAVFLDTATRYTGYACYDVRMVKVADKTLRVSTLVQYGLFKAVNSPDFEYRCLDMTSKISALIREIKPGMLVMEFPTFQGGLKGESCSRSGGTIQLAYLCGRVSVAWEYYITKVKADTKVEFNPARLVTYGQWNGQLPKQITCQRFMNHFQIPVGNAHGIENNFVDAVMMGKWFMEEKINASVNRREDTKRIDY